MLPYPLCLDAAHDATYSAVPGSFVHYIASYFVLFPLCTLSKDKAWSGRTAVLQSVCLTLDGGFPMESKSFKVPGPVDSQVQSRPVSPGPGLNAAELANPAGRKMGPFRAAKATLQFHNRVYT